MASEPMNPSANDKVSLPQLFKHKASCGWATPLPTGAGYWGCNCGLDNLLLELEDYEREAACSQPVAPGPVEVFGNVTYVHNPREKQPRKIEAAPPAVSTPRHCHYHDKHFTACANCADAQAEYDAGFAAARAGAVSTPRCPNELLEWLRERYDNCIRLAAQKIGDDKRGWLEDAAYFEQAITCLQSDSQPAKEKLWTIDEKLEAILQAVNELKERFAGWDKCRCSIAGGLSATSGICNQCGKTAEWAKGPMMRT